MGKLRKYVTSWRGQKSVVCVVSCFPNSITTTCCQLVADQSTTRWQLPVYGEAMGKRV